MPGACPAPLPGATEARGSGGAGASPRKSRLPADGSPRSLRHGETLRVLQTGGKRRMMILTPSPRTAAALPCVRTSGAGRTSGCAPVPIPISSARRGPLSHPSLCKRRDGEQEAGSQAEPPAVGAQRREQHWEQRPALSVRGARGGPGPARASSPSRRRHPAAAAREAPPAAAPAGREPAGLFNFFLIFELDLAPRGSVRPDWLQIPEGFSRVARDAGPWKALSLPCAVDRPKGRVHTLPISARLHVLPGHSRSAATHGHFSPH